MVIRTVQITDINFDLTLDEEDAWELDDVELLQQKLQENYTGQIFELDLENNSTDDEVANELCEEVSAASGWCINSIDFRYVLS